MNVKKLFVLTLFSAAVLLLFSTNAQSQSKSETKLYNSTIKKGTIKAFDKFLLKYPSSLYSKEISHKRDSIHFVSLDGTILSSLHFMQKFPDSDYYESTKNLLIESVLKEKYIQNESLSITAIYDSLCDVSIGEGNYYFFTYMNYLDLQDSKREYVASLIDKSTGALYFAMFSGNLIKDSKNHCELIEGTSMDKESNKSFATPEMTYLLNFLDNNAFLLPISEADLMTDQAVGWWYDENPKGVKNLNFGLLPENSSIVATFKQMKGVEKGNSYNAAFFDLRGNTLVCAYQKKSKEYMLVWCEPVCRNKKTDAILNSIYFENANTLVLYYYKGKTTFKVRINLATKKKN